MIVIIVVRVTVIITTIAVRTIVAIAVSVLLSGTYMLERRG